VIAALRILLGAVGTENGDGPDEPVVATATAEPPQADAGAGV
jgi:hypothetical protein